MIGGGCFAPSGSHSQGEEQSRRSVDRGPSLHVPGMLAAKKRQRPAEEEEEEDDEEDEGDEEEDL